MQYIMGCINNHPVTLPDSYMKPNLDIDPPEAEHGRAIYCDADDSGPVRGGSKTAGGTGLK